MATESFEGWNEDDDNDGDGWKNDGETEKTKDRESKLKPFLTSIAAVNSMKVAMSKEDWQNLNGSMKRFLKCRGLQDLWCFGTLEAMLEADDAREMTAYKGIDHAWVAAITAAYTMQTLDSFMEQFNETLRELGDVQ